MRKLVGIVAAIVLCAPMAQASAQDVPLQSEAPAAEVLVFAAGGTQLSSGYFFPGTRISDGEGGTTGAPALSVPQGSNLRFVNLDQYIVAGGAHKITSFATVKKKGQKRPVPLFSSESVDGPGETTVKTSHVKPGEYLYYCPIHNNMLGAIEIQ